MKSFLEYLNESRGEGRPQQHQSPPKGAFDRSFALARGSRAWQDSNNKTTRRYNLTSLARPIIHSTDNLSTAENDAMSTSGQAVRYVVKHPIKGTHHVSDQAHPTNTVSAFFGGQKIPQKLTEERA